MVVPETIHGRIAAAVAAGRALVVVEVVVHGLLEVERRILVVVDRSLALAVALAVALALALAVALAVAAAGAGTAVAAGRRTAAPQRGAPALQLRRVVVVVAVVVVAAAAVAVNAAVETRVARLPTAVNRFHFSLAGKTKQK